MAYGREQWLLPKVGAGLVFIALSISTPAVHFLNVGQQDGVSVHEV